MSQIICIHTGECKSYKEKCDTCKNNEYKSDPDFYKPAISQQIWDRLFIILFFVGLICVAYSVLNWE